MKLWEALKAFNEGKSVQWRYHESAHWIDVRGDDSFCIGKEIIFRLKPKTVRRPKPPIGFRL